MLTATSTDLTALVRQLIGDPLTPTAIRNECHRLLIAVERNHRGLIEESLDRLTKLRDASEGLSVAGAE
jgi:hypothetical protein